MSKSYTVTQRVFNLDSFEEEDIPAGMTPIEYAERRYCEGYGSIDGHALLIFEGNDIIYDGDDLPEGVEAIENSLSMYDAEEEQS